MLEPTGSLDPANSDDYLEPLMLYVQQQSATKLIYDLKDIPFIDSVYYQWLIRLNTLCSICNVRLVIANMCPTAAFGLAIAGEEIPPFCCVLDVEYARNMK